MIVDENASLCPAQRAILADHYDLCDVKDGDAALLTLNQNATEIDCVLLSLACGDAFEFLNAKRASIPLRSIPVISIVGPEQVEWIDRALQTDTTDVSSSGEMPELLLQRVRNAIRLQENSSLRRALERDPLTGIFNRHTFSRRTAKMLRKKTSEPYQLQVWDVEHFKVVNDLRGTAMGDRVLRAIAKELDSQLRGVGTYARLESDRFALCYPAHLYNPDELLEAANQQLDAMGTGLPIVIYAGVYNVEDIQLSVDQMCDRANMALRTIKGRYHERFAFYDSAMRDRLMQEQAVSSEMNEALQSGQFCFYLQPIYSITSGEPISAEALVRWKHPVRGLIPPSEFIPLFERNGFITRLDSYLWESVCKYLHDLKAEGIEPLPVSVNVSRLNLFNAHLTEDIIAMVRRYQLDPALLKLEITESAYTDNPEQLLTATKALRDYGFEIMMDDFGSGYSSLSMLKDLPVDVLKVDMRFLADMDQNGRAANVMTSIVRMAKWLDIVVIAEGVETQAQISFLRSIGCDGAQGYFYSHPLPEADFSALLHNPAAMLRHHTSDREQLLNDFDVRSLWASNRQISVLFNGMIGAIGLYERTGDALEVLRVNEGYFELLGSTPQIMLHEGKDALHRLEPADQQAVLNACDRATVSHEVEQTQIRCPHDDGRMLWLDVKIRHLGTVSKQSLFYFALADITNQKELERNFLLYQYGAAMLDAYSEVVEMNFTDNIATSFSFSGTGNGYHTRTVPLDYLLQTMPETRVYPEDRALFSRTCERDFLENAFHRQGRHSVSVELRLHSVGEAYQWARLTLHPMDDPKGRFRALCCTRNIDEQKQSEHLRGEYAVLQAKQQEQERYRIILEQTQTALLAWTPDAEHADGNALAQSYRLNAVSCMALLSGALPDDVADPEDMPGLRDYLNSLNGNAGATHLLRLAKTDGETRWCKLCVTVQRDETRMVTAILATVNDVDYEHRIQLQLDTQREQNERRLSMLSHLYWTLPCGILQLDLEDPPKPIFFNRACWELFGFKTKDAFDAVADQDLFTLIAPEEREAFLALLRRCRDENTVEPLDVTVIRPNGATGALRGNVAMSHMSDGRPMLQLVLMDISEQREQELRLERTRATLERTMDMLQHLLENLPVGVTLFEFGSLPQAMYINSRAYRMFGLDANRPGRFMELLQLNASVLNWDPDHPDEAPQGQPGVHIGDVTRVAREDGSTFWLRIYYTIVPQINTPPLCYAVFVDVSNQVEMERAYNRQSELYRIMMEDSQQSFFDYDLETDTMNYTLRAPSGEREERTVNNYLKGLRQSKIIYPEHIPSFVTNLRRFSRSLEPGSHEFMADYFGSSSYRWYRAYFRSLADESGQIYRMIGRVVDIQEDKLREQQLGQAKVFRSAVNSVSLFVFAFDLPEMVPYLLSCEDLKRSGFHPFLDYLAPERRSALVHPDEQAALADALDARQLVARYRNNMRDLTLPFRALNRDNHWIWLELSVQLSAGENKGQLCGIGYVKVIEDRKKLERKATVDGLTQLLNRATMEERISRHLEEEDTPSCLMIFDVDNFKSVNDEYGHSAGDALLRDVAGVLHTHLRQTDIVGRLGGDEFVALLKNATESVALDKGRELLAAISQLNEQTEQHSRITISVGIACAPGDGDTFESLYQAADRALYTAKRLGKNRCYSVSQIGQE